MARSLDEAGRRAPRVGWGEWSMRAKTVSLPTPAAGAENYSIFGRQLDGYWIIRSMPTPTPTPSPSSTVLVQLPADVLDRLSPHESWPSQSWATIIGACIAVLAALLAVWGVLRQIRADLHRARQDRMFGEMRRALRTTNKLVLVLFTDHPGVPVSEWPDADHAAFTKLVDEGYVQGPMLKVLGAPKSGKRLKAFLLRASNLANDPASEGPHLPDLADEFSQTMQDELG
jgi:hypothetical protein